MPPKKNESIVDKIKRNSWSEVREELRLGESYASLLLGLIVVVIVAVIAVLFIKGRGTSPFPTQQVSSDKTENTKEQKSENTYIVSEGESLWGIAEKKYNSGYKWVDIVKANNIPNPDMVETGTKLTLPAIEQQVLPATTPTQTAMQEIQQPQQGEKITGASYTVKTGDFLWNIAVRAYGDGYKWVDIARANGLENPDMIFSESVLNLPR